MSLATAARALTLALVLPACSTEPQANAAVKAELTCSSVRSEYQAARAELRQRVEVVRAADEAARRAGRPDASLNQARQQLMADVERAEGRFAARSKACVGD